MARGPGEDSRAGGRVIPRPLPSKAHPPPGPPHGAALTRGIARQLGGLSLGDPDHLLQVLILNAGGHWQERGEASYRPGLAHSAAEAQKWRPRPGAMAGSWQPPWAARMRDRSLGLGLSGPEVPERSGLLGLSIALVPSGNPHRRICGEAE